MSTPRSHCHFSVACGRTLIHNSGMRTYPDILTEIQLPDGLVTVDEHGYLTNPDLWSDAFAEYAARAEGIRLTPAHEEVIGFIRDWQDKHGTIPDVRFVLKLLAGPQNLTKAQAKDVLFLLFPYGYVKQACKIAGMKQPRAWSTG